MFPRLAIASILSFITILSVQNTVDAQIIPDGTLNSENSVINSSGNRDTISGGAIRGSNLLHSFQEFNVGRLREAYFINPAGIENTIVRVTGGNRSQILGTLGVLGQANLFLINPNGILFGRNARLNLSGNFFATTADSLVFDDGSIFSARNPQAAPLLRINVPIGLQMGRNPGAIINQSQVTNSFPLPSNLAQFNVPQNAGLQVLPGKILGLIGGDITIDGGGLSSSSGQIYLGSVANPGFINFVPTQTGLTFEYNDIQNFGNISILNNSFINTSGISGGTTNIKAGNITLDNSRIYSLTLGNIDGGIIDIQGENFSLNGSQIVSFNLGTGNGSDININATNSANLNGIGIQAYRQSGFTYTISGTFNLLDPVFAMITASLGEGKAGDISINASNLVLQNGFFGGSANLGQGDSGNINIYADNLEIIGSGVANMNTPQGNGKVGDIDINVINITLEEEAILSSLNQGQGTGGNIKITASNDVKILGTLNGALFPTSITTTTLGESQNTKAGEINISTKRLIVSDGGAINSSNGAIFGNNLFSSVDGVGGDLMIKATESVEVFGVSGILRNGGLIPSSIAAQTTTSNRGGDIKITTPRLSVRDGGVISAGSFSVGEAGNINIDAENVEVIGSGHTGRFISQIDVSVNSIPDLVPRLNNEINTDTASLGQVGNAGSLNLKTQNLFIGDKGEIKVQASGNANAGNINIEAKKINLEQQAKIDATTSSGEGGNINIKAEDIFLRSGSNIRTDAGSADGGNIGIDSRFILAILSENSNITANAIEGNGGEINIRTQGVFGLRVNDKPTISSDITASSELGINGAIAISSFKDEPRIIEELPSDLARADRRIAQTCSNQARNNSFRIIGRGGISPSPQEAVNTTPVWQDWRGLPNINTNTNTNTNYSKDTTYNVTKSNIVEANQLEIDEKGNVKLVANFITPHRNFTVKDSGCKK